MKIVSENFTVSTEILTFLFLLILYIFLSFTYIFRWFRQLIQLTALTPQEKDVCNTDRVAERSWFKVAIPKLNIQNEITLKYP